MYGVYIYICVCACFFSVGFDTTNQFYTFIIYIISHGFIYAMDDVYNILQPHFPTDMARMWRLLLRLLQKCPETGFIRSWTASSVSRKKAMRSTQFKCNPKKIER